MRSSNVPADEIYILCKKKSGKENYKKFMKIISDITQRIREFDFYIRTNRATKKIKAFILCTSQPNDQYLWYKRRLCDSDCTY